MEERRSVFKRLILKYFLLLLLILAHRKENFQMSQLLCSLMPPFLSLFSRKNGIKNSLFVLVFKLIINTFFLSSCWPTGDPIGRSTRNSNPVMTSSVCLVPTTSIGRWLVKSTQLYGLAATLRQHMNSLHSSTNPAQCCLTSVIVRELVFPSA